MCGLFGVTNDKKIDVTSAREALHTLAHRGPDQWNDFFDKDVYIGHRRLSILDISDLGKQPMVSSDGLIVVAVNGEIYNFPELKLELEDRYTFCSSSDSEIVLHGFIEWGIDGLVEKLDGMYAISIYDCSTRDLFLVRDRTGIKPLYYGTIDGEFTWASELKAIEKFYEKKFPLTYDYSAFYDFLTYLYIPTPKTMYEDVFKLEPATYLHFNLDSKILERHQYWSLSVGGCIDDVHTAAQKVKELLKKSVQEQMVSDVDVGFFLSGGIDSSCVTAIAAKAGHQVKAFSIGFSHKTHDETYFAALVATMHEVEHGIEIIDETSVQDSFHRIKDWYDEPFGDTSCFPTYAVSSFARQNVAVALTGDGADEIFGGYNWYKEFINIKQFPKFQSTYFKGALTFVANFGGLAAKLAKKIELYFKLDDLEIYTRLLGGMLREEKESYRILWGLPDDYDDYWYFRKFYDERLPIFSRLQSLDFHTYLHDDIFTKVDRVSMSVSLECRVPFMKKELVEYCFSLEDSVRLPNSSLKGLLKMAFNEYLPEPVLSRRKKGFSIPLHDWDKVIGDAKNRQLKILEMYDLKVGG